MGEKGDQTCKIFIGGLNINTTTEGLRSYFEQFGTVVDAIVMVDPQTQRSRCFGFVTYENRDSVDAAQAARPHTIDDKQVDSKRAIPKEDAAPESRVPCVKLFVGGLRKDVTEEHLHDYFSQYGTITTCQLVTDKISGVSRGFGFVTFDDNDAVDKAIISRPHKIHDSKADVKKALSKDEIANIKPTRAAGGRNDGGRDNGNGYGGGHQGGDVNPYGGGGYGDQGGYRGGPGAPSAGGYGAGGYANQGGGYYGGGYAAPNAYAPYQPPNDYYGGYAAAAPAANGYGTAAGGYDYNAGYQQAYPSGGPMKQGGATRGGRRN